MFLNMLHGQLREYVEDTEDYINIMLDDKQNHLLQMGVMLSTASLIVNAFVVVVGAFGMNINIDLFKGDTPAEKELGMHNFTWTVGGCTTGSIILYIIAIAWCKNQRLLEWFEFKWEPLKKVTVFVWGRTLYRNMWNSCQNMIG